MKRKDLQKAASLEAALGVVTQLLAADHIVLQAQGTSALKIVITDTPSGPSETKENRIFSTIKNDLEGLKTCYEEELTSLGVEL